MSRSANFCIDRRSERIDKSRALNQLASDTYFGTARWTTAYLVEGGAHYWVAPRSMRCASRSGSGGTN